jgi:hypothetical protein
MHPSGNDFLNEARISDLVWIGETHGIQQNYLLYQLLITLLFKNGYKIVALELPIDLEVNSKSLWNKFIDYQDGRISKESYKFINWMIKNNIKYICFDSNNSDQQQREYQMAENLMSKTAGAKSIVITGSFHSQKSLQKVDNRNIIPMSGVVENAQQSTILRLGIKYLGGSCFNYKIKEINRSHVNFDELSLNFGEFSYNSNSFSDVKFWIHGGVASPVTLLTKKI